MNQPDFEALQLKYWDCITFFLAGGKMCVGNYADEYDNSNGTFKFSNHSNGKTETIKVAEIENLQK